MRRSATQAKPAPPRPATPDRARPQLPVWLIFVLLVLVTMALYWPATGHDFVDYDDGLYVNAHVQRGLTWPSIRWAFSNLEAGFWHPLTWLSILLDCQFYGLQAWGHHLTSVLLHAVSTGVLFLALQRMTGATWRSAFVAGLFGWHPLHVESVAWVSERKEVLSGFFCILTLLVYACYAEGRRQKPEDRDRWSLSHLPSSMFYLLSLFFFALGLMSKPMVVTLPLILLLLDWWPLQRLPCETLSRKLKQMLRLIWQKVPFLAAAFVCGVATIYARGGVGTIQAETAFPLARRVQNALLSYVAYLKQTLWPTDLAAFYPYPETIPAWRAAGAGLVVLLLSALLLWAPRKRPYLAVGWTVVHGDAAAGDRTHPHRHFFAGGSVYVCAAHRGVPRVNLGCGRTGPTLAVSCAGVVAGGRGGDCRLPCVDAATTWVLEGQ